MNDVIRKLAEQMTTDINAAWDEWYWDFRDERSFDHALTDAIEASLTKRMFDIFMEEHNGTDANRNIP